MPRIVSIWLRSWPIARRLKDEQKKSSASADAKLDIRRPLVLVAQGAGGARISALNAAAAHAGLTQGELLSNARSKVLDLQVRDADPAADAAALEKLGLWCVRYTPTVSAWDDASGADGLFLDVEASIPPVWWRSQAARRSSRPPAEIWSPRALCYRRNTRRGLGLGALRQRADCNSAFRSRGRRPSTSAARSPACFPTKP